MIQKFKKILALTLALTVLVSSHSFAWFEHLCTITKIKSVSFTPESCAGDLTENTHDTTLSKGTCCEVTLKVNKAENAIQQNYTFYSFVAEVMDFPVFQFDPETQYRQEETVMGRGNVSPPLILPLYILNQQFII